MKTGSMTIQQCRVWKSSLLVLTVVMFGSCAEEREMTRDSHVHHGIDYIEFAVTDMAGTKRFYSAAVDWKFNDCGPDYAGIQKEGGEAGGLRLDANVSTGGPLVVLYSKDLDATRAMVIGAGGRITKEPFDFPGGSRFHFTDPSGNELAVWAAG